MDGATGFCHFALNLTDFKVGAENKLHFKPLTNGANDTARSIERNLRFMT